jgi:hypothetical protein
MAPARAYGAGVTARDWLLLLIAARPAAQPLDPMRLQKGMFLLSREAGLEPSERYWFVPYNYGPMSAAVYRDLTALTADGLVEQTAVPGRSWRRFEVTEAGRAHARALRRRARRRSPEAVDELARIKRSIVRMTVGQLIADVYDRYPYFASKAAFRRG